MSTVGQRLKEIRAEKRLTQTAFGEILGVSKQAISNIESSHSNPSIDIMSKLFENLEVNLNWFITGQGKMFNTKEPTDDELTLRVKKILKDEGVI